MSADGAFAKEVVAFLEKHQLSDALSAFNKGWGSKGGKEPEKKRRSTHAPSASPDKDRSKAAAATDPRPLVSKKYGVASIAGLEADLWDCEELHNSQAPSYTHGAGISYEQYTQLPKGRSDLVACKPYLKEAPPGGLPLESFDLRVIYEAGRTGFEEAREFPIVVGSVVAGRYQVVQYIDSAAFSRTVRCLDLKHGHDVCVKIIRNSKDFFDQALDEIKLLQYINCSGEPEEHCVVQLYDYFYFKEHVFIVCELLKDNLYEFSKFSRENETEYYFTLARVQCIAKQVVRALDFIHGLKLLHCDLKPENILIKSCSRCEVKVIDFGSSCYTTDNLSSYVQSRCYRAPEVILGCHYDGRIDVWSLGVILPELLTGQLLFHNESVAGMLARIAGVCGAFPARILHEGRHTCKYVTSQGVFFDRSRDGEPTYYFPHTSPLAELNLGSDDQYFRDFVTKCLTVDYTLRPTSKELMQHQFLKQDYGPVYSPPPPLKTAAPS